MHHLHSELAAKQSQRLQADFGSGSCLLRQQRLAQRTAWSDGNSGHSVVRTVPTQCFCIAAPCIRSAPLARSRARPPQLQRLDRWSASLVTGLCGCIAAASSASLHKPITSACSPCFALHRWHGSRNAWQLEKCIHFPASAQERRGRAASQPLIADHSSSVIRLARWHCLFCCRGLVRMRGGCGSSIAATREICVLDCSARRTAKRA